MSLTILLWYCGDRRKCVRVEIGKEVEKKKDKKFLLVKKGGIWVRERMA